MKKTSNDALSKGPLGGTNFLISIRSMQNNTWQGVLEWLETGEKIHFRSTLEMILLLEEAAQKNSSQVDYSHIRSWHIDGNTVNIY